MKLTWEVELKDKQTIVVKEKREKERKKKKKEYSLSEMTKNDILFNIMCEFANVKTHYKNPSGSKIIFHQETGLLNSKVPIRFAME